MVSMNVQTHLHEFDSFDISLRVVRNKEDCKDYDSLSIIVNGETVHTVQGDACNVKITAPDDLRLMRAILGVKPPAERPVHKRF